MRGKYDQPTWLTVSKSINDSLRQAQRDALVAYLLPAMGLTDADQLFEYFLIDPEMCACMETSRIKQAISSVQLFVQRVLLHLEDRPDVPEISVSPSAIDAKVWSQWKGQIGPWQANREIFLYPENWLESSLRDDKSPFFKDLEATLLQNEITSDNVQAAFEAYLTAVDQIKSLEICAMYWEDVDPDTKAPINTLHVFGRTRQQPRMYFYRRRLNNSVWTPWEKISTSVEGDHLIPVVWNRRLILYWATFAQKTETPNLGSTVTLGQPVAVPSQYLEIALSWSEYKQGKWTPKQIADSGISLSSKGLGNPMDPTSFQFRTEIQKNASGLPSALLIHCAEGSGADAIYGPGPNKLYLLRTEVGTFRVGVESLESLSAPPQNQVSDTPLAVGFENLTPSAMVLDSDGTSLAFVGSRNGPSHMILKATPNPLRVLAPPQYDPYQLQAPFFFQDDSSRVFFAAPTDSEAYLTQVADPNTVTVDKYVQGVASPNGLPSAPLAQTEFWAAKGRQYPSLFLVPRLLWDVHYHPFVTAFSKALARDGVPGLLSEDTETLGNPYRHSPWKLAVWGSTASVSEKATGPASIVQTDAVASGTVGDFHAVVLEGTNLTHYQKSNSGAVPGQPWQVVDGVSTQATGPGCLVQNGDLANGNARFHVVVLEGTDLVHYSRDVTAAAQSAWTRGIIPSKATGRASLALGASLNAGLRVLELVSLEGTSAVHYTCSDGTNWNTGETITKTARSAACIIQGAADRVLEMIVCDSPAVASTYPLVHYTFDGSKWTRGDTITTKATDAGAIVQSTIRNGSLCHFEVVVPEGSALVHYWYDPSTLGEVWRQGQVITNKAAGTPALIQSTLGQSPGPFRGNFEVLTLEGDPQQPTVPARVAHYWNSNDGLFQFAETYQPDPGMVVDPYPTENVDFRYGGSHSLYNWETFFYAPLLIATTLSANQRFEEAMDWFHYIFFPMDDTTFEQPPSRYWKFQPFKDVPQTRLVDMLSQLDEGDPDLEAQIQDWTQNPFAPFRLARLRRSAFQKNVFKRYLDNVIRWADQLFIRDTIESINQATQLYILAAHLLGKRGKQVPPRTVNVVETYTELAAKLDSFGDAVVTLENAFPFTTGVVANTMGDTAGLLGVSTSFYFCVPENDELLGYWDTVADRLFKIRNCMNIQGVAQQLPLFEPPIDPALLVQAAARGADLASILNDISAPMPYYRFSYMLQKALDLCAEVRSLGAALLAALEKGDAEALALLRATQETNILGLMQQMKSYACDEAENQWLALTASRNTAFSRYSYYQQMLTGSVPPAPADGTDLPLQPVPSTMGTELSADSTSRLLAEEQSELDSSQSANAQQSTIEGMQRVSAYMSLFPNVALNTQPMGVGVSVTWGSQNLIENMRGYVAADQAQATELSYDAAHAGKMAGYYRRQLEWTLQSNLAAGEFNQLNRQLLAAKIRLQSASYDLNTLYPRQLQNAQALQDAYTNKYTNQELYSWMAGQIGATYFQCYNLAYRQAKMAEQTFRYQSGMVDSSFIRFGYWDSLRKGLQSAEQLYLALKQLESAYQDQNKREFEITKRVSLALLDPFALISLKETGQCAVTLPEALFDVDYPGHYMRRIKSVSLTIPCVTGPYTSVNCTMTLLKSKTRLQAAVGAGYAEQDSDPRFAYNFAATDSIATSTAENDSGMFEVSFHDERYLPFEGSGAVSEWRLVMPKDNNAFDYETITDVVLNLLYTARWA